VRSGADEGARAMELRGTTAAGGRKGRGEFAAKVGALRGPYKPPAKWKTVVERTTDLEDHRREELVLQAEGHLALPLYLLVPKGKGDSKRPGVLALHGHGAHGHHPVAGRDDLPGVEQ